MNEVYYIYSLSCPVSNKVKYIGRSQNPEKRLLQHSSSENGNKKLRGWIESLNEENKKPVISILQGVKTFEQSVKRERFWIKKYSDLLNTNTGYVFFLGFYGDAQVKRKIIKLMNKGKKYSDIMRESLKLSIDKIK